MLTPTCQYSYLSVALQVPPLPKIPVQGSLELRPAGNCLVYIGSSALSMLVVKAQVHIPIPLEQKQNSDSLQTFSMLH